MGADRKLADWAQIVDYFRNLDAAAERVKIDGEGRTTLGKPFLAVVITSEKNMGDLEAIRQANLRLFDPRGLSDEEAAKLVATGKTIVTHNHGFHATEVAAPQTSMELAYLLATSQDPRILDILDKTVRRHAHRRRPAPRHRASERQRPVVRQDVPDPRRAGVESSGTGCPKA